MRFPMRFRFGNNNNLLSVSLARSLITLWSSMFECECKIRVHSELWLGHKMHKFYCFHGIFNAARRKWNHFERFNVADRGQLDTFKVQYNYIVDFWRALGSQIPNSSDRRREFARRSSMWKLSLCWMVNVRRSRASAAVEFLHKPEEKKPQHPRNRTCCHTMNVIIAIETLSRNNCKFQLRISHQRNDRLHFALSALPVIDASMRSSICIYIHHIWENERWPVMFTCSHYYCHAVDQRLHLSIAHRLENFPSRIENSRQLIDR